MKDILAGKAWSHSTREEVISALWLIAGLQAWGCGLRVFAVILFVKSAADTVCSIGCAFAEALRSERGEGQ